MTATTELIPFANHQIEALMGPDGRPQVVPKRICENLGLAFPPQYTKLSTAKWATVTMIVTVAPDGKEREQCCIDLDTMFFWLATINPSKVAKEARPALEAYQQYLKGVIADHFLGRQQQQQALHLQQSYLAGAQQQQVVMMQMMAAHFGQALQALQLQGPRAFHNPAAPFQGATLPAREHVASTAPRPRWSPPAPEQVKPGKPPGKPKGILEKLIAVTLEEGPRTSKELARSLCRGYPEVVRALTEMERRGVVERLGGPRAPSGGWRLVRPN